MQNQRDRIVSVLIILLLLPYILTIFINGKNMQNGNYQTGEMVTVDIDGEVKELLWEDYLLGIVARSIPIDFELESMKVQAVIARTSLYMSEDKVGNKVFHEPYLTLEEIERKWNVENSVEVYNQLKNAILLTNDEVVTIDGKMCHLPYHYISIGTTRDGMTVFGDESYKYLMKVSCPLDIKSEDYLHIHEINYEELKMDLGIDLGVDKELTYHDLKILSSDESGYVMQVMVADQLYSGEDFAKLLGLESSAFSLQSSENALKISVTGKGHGLGLSQNTANYMALEGKTYVEILQYFYTGSQVTNYKEITE